MLQADTTKLVENLVKPLLEHLGIELVDMEFKREGRQMVLRFFIDKEGGITLDDCAAVSREVSAVLDVEEVIQCAFSLEVSSPGLNRPLKTEADFRRYAGRLVKIKTFELLPDDDGNRRKTFLGELLGLDGNLVRLRLREGQTSSIPLDAIDKANLEFES
jgi:ribosome maturation factor RimP